MRMPTGSLEERPEIEGLSRDKIRFITSGWAYIKIKWVEFSALSRLDRSGSFLADAQASETTLMVKTALGTQARANYDT